MYLPNWESFFFLSELYLSFLALCSINSAVRESLKPLSKEELSDRKIHTWHWQVKLSRTTNFSLNLLTIPQ